MAGNMPPADSLRAIRERYDNKPLFAGATRRVALRLRGTSACLAFSVRLLIGGECCRDSVIWLNSCRERVGRVQRRRCLMDTSRVDGTRLHPNTVSITVISLQSQQVQIYYT